MRIIDIYVFFTAFLITYIKGGTPVQIFCRRGLQWRRLHLLIFFTEVIKFYWLMLLYPGELYKLLGASSLLLLFFFGVYGFFLFWFVFGIVLILHFCVNLHPSVVFNCVLQFKVSAEHSYICYSVQQTFLSVSSNPNPNPQHNFIAPDTLSYRNLYKILSAGTL